MFFGYEEAKKYKNIFNQMFVYMNNTSQVKQIDLKTSNNSYFFNCEWKQNEAIFTLNRSFLDNYPKKFKDSETTGFATYFFIKQYFKPSKIILCNFGINDDRFNKTKTHHGIEYENNFFNMQNIERILI